MSDKDNITLPREVVELATKAFENGCPPTCEKGMIDSGGFHPWGEPALVPCPACLAFEHLRTALAAEQPKPSGNFDNQGAVLLLRSKSAEIERLKDDSEALRRDAERWRFYETAGSDLTLRLHNTRSDHRNAVIDAAMGDKT